MTKHIKNLVIMPVVMLGLVVARVIAPATALAAEVQSGTFRFRPGALDANNDLSATYTYSDDYFATSSSQYHSGLAAISMALAASGHPTSEGEGESDYYAHQSQNVRNLLEELGFSDISVNQDFASTPTSTSFGIAVAHKQITLSGVDYQLVVVVPRSGKYGAEWVSNFMVGADGDHEGFSQAAGSVEAFVDDYISTHVSDTEHLKLWLTGHSRGAAVDNLAAKYYTDRYGADRVYFYGFSTPTNTSADNAAARPYPNLINIIGKSDFLANAFANWGMSRYGVVAYGDQEYLDLSADAQLQAQTNALLAQLGSTISYDPDSYQAYTMMPVALNNNINPALLSKLISGNLPTVDLSGVSLSNLDDPAVRAKLDAAVATLSEFLEIEATNQAETADDFGPRLADYVFVSELLGATRAEYAASLQEGVRLAFTIYQSAQKDIVTANLKNTFSNYYIIMWLYQDSFRRQIIDQVLVGTDYADLEVEQKTSLSKAIGALYTFLTGFTEGDDAIAILDSYDPSVLATLAMDLATLREQTIIYHFPELLVAALTVSAHQSEDIPSVAPITGGGEYAKQ